LGSFGILLPDLVCCKEKILATLISCKTTALKSPTDEAEIFAGLASFELGPEVEWLQRTEPIYFWPRTNGGWKLTTRGSSHYLLGLGMIRHRLLQLFPPKNTLPRSLFNPFQCAANLIATINDYTTVRERERERQKNRTLTFFLFRNQNVKILSNFVPKDNATLKGFQSLNPSGSTRPRRCSPLFPLGIVQGLAC
jgi:hypothetical protein